MESGRQNLIDAFSNLDYCNLLNYPNSVEDKGRNGGETGEFLR